jgi:hypothetical protein
MIYYKNEKLKIKKGVVVVVAAYNAQGLSMTGPR